MKTISEKKLTNAIKKLTRNQLETFVFHAAVELYGELPEEGTPADKRGEFVFNQAKEWTQDTVEGISTDFNQLKITPDDLSK